SSNVPHPRGSQLFTAKPTRQQTEQSRSLTSSSVAHSPPQGPTLLAQRPAPADSSLILGRAGPVSPQQSPKPSRCMQNAHLQSETATEATVSNDPNRVEGSSELEEPGSPLEAAHQPGTVAETATPDSPSREVGFH
ncbi:Uncharacterized protein APZ42_008081, partial [Daphnia magna]